MKSILFAALAAVLLASCAAKNDEDPAKLKQQAIEAINKAESDFQKMSAEKGIMEAFYFYADSNAVIKRENDTLIKGKDAIKNYYSADFYKKASVTWAPDFTDASEKGDVGYTYGKYTWQSKDSTGKVSEFKGIFHTVWKRQADSTWKYVWD